MYYACQNSKHKYSFLIIQKLLTFIFFTSIHMRNGLLLPNYIDTRVNLLAVTSYNRVKGHIMWINVSPVNGCLHIYWKHSKKLQLNRHNNTWVIHKGLWKCHEPRDTTNPEIPTVLYWYLPLQILQINLGNLEPVTFQWKQSDTCSWFWYRANIYLKELPIIAGYILHLDWELNIK